MRSDLIEKVLSNDLVKKVTEKVSDIFPKNLHSLPKKITKEHVMIGAAVTATVSTFLIVKSLYASKIEFPREDVRALAQKIFNKTSVDDLPLKGIVAIVTGSTGGLGKEIAAELYNLGCHVVVASRNKAKVIATIKEIESFYGKKGTLEIGELDTSDLDHVRAFTKRFKDSHDDLHILVNNAGIHYMANNTLLNLRIRDEKAHVSPQGYDMAFATNYVGHFLLTKDLTDLIIKSSERIAKTHPEFKGRIVNVASAFHMHSTGESLRPTKENPTPFAARGDLQSGYLHMLQKYTAYGNNKLSQVLHAKQLTRLFNKSTDPAAKFVKAVATCPGWTKTNILPDDIIGRFIASNAFPANAAALGGVMACLDPGLQGGEFTTNYIDILAFIPGVRTAFFVTKKISPWLRGFLVDGLALVLLQAQIFSFGYHIDPSSDESNDELLAAELYEWTEKDLIAKGY